MVFVLLILAAILLACILIYFYDNSSEKNLTPTGCFPSFTSDLQELKGYAGESMVKRELSLLPADEYIVLNDVLLPTKKGTTQLDHVVVSLYGIFAIETKNYSGKIYGGRNSLQWTQYLGGQKYVFHNPLLQNQGHVKAVESLIHVRPCDIVPIVVFTGSGEIKTDVGNHVVQIDQLYNLIRQYHKHKFSREQIALYAKKIDDVIEETIETKSAHVDCVREKIQYKNVEISSGNCPVCDGYLVLRHGKYGAFYGCSNYPRCKYSLKK